MWKCFQWLLESFNKFWNIPPLSFIYGFFAINFAIWPEHIKGKCGHGADDEEDVQDGEGNQELVEEVSPQILGGENGDGGEGAKETDAAKGHEQHSLAPVFDHEERLQVQMATSCWIKASWMI